MKTEFVSSVSSYEATADITALSSPWAQSPGSRSRGDPGDCRHCMECSGCHEVEQPCRCSRLRFNHPVILMSFSRGGSARKDNSHILCNFRGRSDVRPPQLGMRRVLDNERVCSGLESILAVHVINSNPVDCCTSSAPALFLRSAARRRPREAAYIISVKSTTYLLPCSLVLLTGCHWWRPCHCIAAFMPGAPPNGSPMSSSGLKGTGAAKVCVVRASRRRIVIQRKRHIASQRVTENGKTVTYQQIDVVNI